MAPQLKNNLLLNNSTTNQDKVAKTLTKAAKPKFVIPYNLISWLVPLALILTWEVLVQSGIIAKRILPAPSTVLNTAWQLTVSGVLPNNLWVSLGRAATGFVIGSVIALTLGFLVGLSRLAEAFFDRSIQMIRTIPFLSILPLVIVWFGVGEAGKIFLVALGVSFPIYINTVLGIRQVDPKLQELGRSYGLNRRQLIWQVTLPAALPSILVGFRYALGIAWLALVVAETIGASAGLGFMTMDAREFLRTDVIVLAIIIYAFLGITVDVIIRFLERRLLAWHPNYAKLSR